jgi:hypothetical protein
VIETAATVLLLAVALAILAMLGIITGLLAVIAKLAKEDRGQQ